MTGSFSALTSGSLVADGPDFWGRVMTSRHNHENPKEKKERKHFTLAYTYHLFLVTRYVILSVPLFSFLISSDVNR